MSMKIMPGYEPVKVPADWTAEKDIMAFIDRHGESNDYFGDQLERVFKEFDRLERTIARALTYFGLGQATDLAAGLPQRIASLRQHILGKAPSERYRERFSTNLFWCSMAIDDYARIVPDCGREERTWLLQLLELSERLTRAWRDLEESMLCEHDDFKHRADLPDML